MSSTWTCFQCASVNAAIVRHCGCGARRPPFVETIDEDGEESGDEPALVDDEAGPHDDGLLSGLQRLVALAGSGQTAPPVFAEQMRTASRELERVFIGIIAEVQRLPDVDRTYVQTVQEGLLDAMRLFQVALRELEQFAPTDPARLRIGMLVAEKANEHYESLLADVRKDAAGHTFMGKPDQVRTLGGAVLEGSLSLEDYRLRLLAVRDRVGELLRSGGEHLEAGFEAALAFDGVQPDGLSAAADHLTQASHELGQVILAIHSPETVRRAARDILSRAAGDAATSGRRRP